MRGVLELLAPVAGVFFTAAVVYVVVELDIRRCLRDDARRIILRR